LFRAPSYGKEIEHGGKQYIVYYDIPSYGVDQGYLPVE
jgi:hypothetical protein